MPNSVLENLHNELRVFLETIQCVQEFQEAKTGGPIQNVPTGSNAYEIGCRILLPLPWGRADLANQIMERVKEWAKLRGVERFGFIDRGNCPLLFIGLREKPAAS